MKISFKRGAWGTRAAGILLALLTTAMLAPANAAGLSDMPEANIVQSRGVDAAVDYSSLTKYGLWDDRNYQLTKDDLKFLSPTEHKLTNKIPAFFRVELRKEWPHLSKTGAAQYPRAAWQVFKMRHGGFMRNGQIYGKPWGKDVFASIRADNELQLNQVLGANEITVEINPTNSDNIIAGSNNNGGQEMYYSQDGGQSWTIQGTLPNTCCDPTIGWSSDGTVAYAAALSGPIGVSFWRSLDQGVTWQDRVDLTTSGSDKEWLHVDISPASPFQDNIYLTYHNGNVMQFARSTNGGTSFSIQAFGSAPSGIGSDITTTSNGDIYYTYGAFGTQQIILLKSTNGGVSFGPPIVVDSTNGSFDWPIPAMESRNAWIYTAVDADRSGGTYDGSVYVSWTDTIDPENDGSASANRTHVWVAYSRDGGATWARTNPHPTADSGSVDRFNQWMTVDEFGNVHAVYYDTRNSTGRTGVDLYYAISTDGAQTWSTPERVSSATSANLSDGQEWGDYNGISVVGEKIIPVWTDNRNGPPNEKDVYAAELLNAGAAPGFTMGAQSAATLSQEVCTPDNLAPITLDIGQLQGFANPVSLSTAGLPGGFIANFSANPVNPPGTSVASVSVGTVADGSYSFTINGTAAGANSRSVGVEVDTFSAAPAAPTGTAPANGASDVSTSVTFSWTSVSGASGYTLEVDDDPAFSSIDFSVSTAATSATLPGNLSSDTTYYWRVRADNPCGSGANSATRSLTTATEICRAPALAIPDGNPAGTADTAVLSDTGTILSLEVSIDTTHTYVGDLAFTLTHASSGTSVVLIDRPGYTGTGFGCSANNIDVTLSDSSAIPVETQCSATPPALGGILQPQQPLAAFAGDDIGGTWTLSVSDNAGQDVGVVNEWCLLPVLDNPATDTDGDGVEDSADNCTLVSNADQRDTNGDGFGNICDPDLNNDGVVNAVDLGLFRTAFFSTGAGLDADFNGDNQVNTVDLGVMRSLFFGPPGPAGNLP